ncbi:MAG: hypothetical protein ABWX96_21840 [Propionibacteriaceae bacterium]
MGQLLGAAVAIGVAGIDPTAALIAVAALVAGATSRALTAFAVTVMVGAPLLGTLLSLTIAARLAGLDWWVLVPRGRLGAVVGLAVGAALLTVGVVRLLRRPTQRPTTPRRHRVGTLALVGAGAAYVGSLLIDPTFIAVTVLAGRSRLPLEVIMMQCVWVLISQLPLIALLVAVSRFGQQLAVERFQAWWSRAQPVLRVVVTVALVGMGLILVVDALWWFTTGHFLLPAP